VAQASTSPLVGRTEQLAVLREAASYAARGEPAVVLVQGEAGIGKTRLVGELLTRLPAGWTVARGACSEAAGRTLPFAPWIEVLRDLDGRVDPDVLELLLPREAAPSAAPVSTGRLYGAISDGLLTAARRAPIVVVVEDVHWSDGASRDVTEFVSRAMRSQRLLLVVTARTDDPAYATARPLLGELERIDHSLSVHLERLQPVHVEAMARALGAHDWSADQVAALAARSDGVPYFVEELVRGSLSSDGGVAGFANRAVGHRLAGLDAPTGRVVSLAALAFGDPTDGLLARAAALAEPDYERAVTEAVRRGVLAVDGRGGYRFRHALLGEAALDSLLPRQRTRLHRAWGEAWDRQPGASETRTAALAHHWLGADDDRALLACLAAADRAGRLSAFAERLRLLTAAARRWPETPVEHQPSGLDLADVHLEAADAARMLGDPGSTRTHLDAALLQLDQSDAARRAWVGLSELLLDSVHDVPHSGDDYLSLLARIPRQPPDRRRKEACDRVALRLSLVGRYDEAVSCATEALALGTALGDPDDMDRLRSTLAIILALAGDHPRAVELVAELRRRLSDRTDLATASDILGSASLVAWMTGDTERALRDARSASHLLGGDRPGPMPAKWAAETLNEAENLMELGRWDEAAGCLERVVAAGSITPRVSGWGERLCIHLGAWRGTLDTDRFLAYWEDHTFGGWPLLPDLQDVLPHLFSLTDAFAYAGSYDRARGPALSVLEQEAMELAPLAYLLPLLATVAREEADRALLQDADACSLRLAGRIDQLLGARPPVTDRDAAFASLVRAELLRGAGNDRTEAWCEAVARWRPTGMPQWLARALLGQGRSAGERGPAQRGLEEAARIAQQLGARPLLEAVQAAARRQRIPLATGQAPPDPWGLTARELEVLRLMTEGATNDAIGRRLFISAKTVSVHVTHILAKLQVDNRTAAADVARRRGVVPLRTSRASGAMAEPFE
jgi:DNA-binding CsgD family transcriptional regulator/tetratricopeptide (TPR) repeat protein